MRTLSIITPLILALLCVSGASTATANAVVPSVPEIRNPHMGVCTHFVRKKGMRHWDPQKYMPMVAELGPMTAESIARAHAMLEGGHTQGKLVLTVG